MTGSIRVMQSFEPPRSTTNPYIVMLDRALAAQDGLEHLRFSWRAALFGRYDAIHLHWPESRLHGSRPWKARVKHLMMGALVLRLRISRIAVVRTVHNLELPTDLTPLGRRLLLKLDAMTSYRILLNTTTPLEEGTPHSVILHGHYRDWFAGYPKLRSVRGRIGYFGLIRRYKGVESLLEAYADARAQDPTLSLRVGGRPSSSELAQTVRSAADALPGLEATLRFLDDAELVELATGSQLIVLPYRLMHNSGGAIAALSLDRPVLLPRNEANLALAEEVGEGWVRMYDGELTAEHLRSAVAWAADRAEDDRPDLSHREWDDAGPRHLEAFREAVRLRAVRAPGRRAAGMRPAGGREDAVGRG